ADCCRIWMPTGPCSARPVRSFSAAGGDGGRPEPGRRPPLPPNQEQEATRWNFATFLGGRPGGSSGLRFRVISSARHGTPCSSWRTPKPTSSAILGSCRHDRRRLFGKARILEFPADFPSRARAKVEAEEIRATRAFDQARETLPWSPYGP